MKQTVDRILELVKQIVDSRMKESLTLDSRLFDERILDSFGVIQLVLEIDKEFSISIKNEDLTSQNFGTIRDIGALVDIYASR